MACLRKRFITEEKSLQHFSKIEFHPDFFSISHGNKFGFKNFVKNIIHNNFWLSDFQFYLKMFLSVMLDLPKYTYSICNSIHILIKIGKNLYDKTFKINRNIIQIFRECFEGKGQFLIKFHHFHKFSYNFLTRSHFFTYHTYKKLSKA